MREINKINRIDVNLASSSEGTLRAVSTLKEVSILIVNVTNDLLISIRTTPSVVRITPHTINSITVLAYY